MLNAGDHGVSTNRPYRQLADLTSRELHRRAAEYRRMAILARGGETIRALNWRSGSRCWRRAAKWKKAYLARERMTSEGSHGEPDPYLVTNVSLNHAWQYAGQFQTGV
jgi:hypothetical protein